MPWAVDLSMETQSAYAETRGIPGVGHGFASLRDHRARRRDRRHRPRPAPRVANTRSTTGCRPIAPGAGYVTEAAQALLDWARDALGARRILLNAGMENRRSLAVAERLGFTRDGELEGGMTGGSVADLSRVPCTTSISSRCA